MTLLTVLSVCLLALLSYCQTCSDGVLVVGGSTQDGPHQSVKLLRDDGWCQTSGFPDLPEPLGKSLRCTRR